MSANSKSASTGLTKSLTGIAGLDEITCGGLPQGRPTLVCGSAGSGKTLLGMEFLVRGATQYGENGVYIAFEEYPSSSWDTIARGPMRTWFA